jgi:hypothetical protein
MLITRLAAVGSPRVAPFHAMLGTEIEIEIVYNNTRINRMLSMGPPCFAMLGLA